MSTYAEIQAQIERLQKEAEDLRIKELSDVIKDIKAKIRVSFSQKINLINESHLNGFVKLWLYQFYTVHHLSWPFIVFDLDRTFSLVWPDFYL